MEMSLWQQIAELPAVEIIAAVMGVISVWFARSNNILVYPTGIVSVTLYVIICLNVQLYADAFINFYYL
ncbi:MAG TPA: nicotinamide mononucleotide transporter, partial [Bacteroidetes bacterium]|nr:nicotinamide mononucleotide transporter [Bacteroidota bacterium]